MILYDNAMQRAQKIEYPQPGEIITLPIEVCMAFMDLYGLERERWIGDGNILVLRKGATPPAPLINSSLSIKKEI